MFKNVMKRKVKNRKNTKAASVEISENDAKSELTSQQMTQVLRAVLSYHPCSAKNPRIGKLFHTLFENSNVPVATINTEPYLHSVLKNPRRSVQLPF